MDDDITRPPRTTKRRQRRRLGAGFALVGLLVAVGPLAGACGGGSKDPAAVSAGSTSTTTGSTSTTSSATASSATAASSGSSGSSSSGQSAQSEELEFSQCMRSHGVSDFPDPPANAGMLNAISAAGVNTQSPTYQAALQACKKYSPGGNLSAAQSAAQNAKGVEFSQCMRLHGVPNYPDPISGPTGGQAINLHGTGIDPSGPIYQAANSACQKVVPGSK
jgi:hypothetical protein